MKLGNPIATGNTAQLYLCDGKAVKVFAARLSENEAEYEANKQRIAYSCGLPVPRVFDVTRVDGRQAIVMEYVKGAPFGELILQDPERTEAILARSVDTQLEMHAKSAPALEPMHDKLARQLRSAAALDEETRAGLLSRLVGMPTGNSLCHGDFHVFNLIQTEENKTVVIDWVDASAGDPNADVYRTYLLYLLHIPELAEPYLRLYREKSGLSRDGIFAWAPIIAGAKLSENVPSEKTEQLLDIIARRS